MPIIQDEPPVAIDPVLEQKLTDFSTAIDAAIVASDAAVADLKSQRDALDVQRKALAQQIAELDRQIAEATPNDVKVARFAKDMQERLASGKPLPPHLRMFR